MDSPDGPVESGRGFVLHTTDYLHDTSVEVDADIALTASVDIIRDIVENQGPARHILALGYAGWSAGQLDRELRENAWLVVDADPDLVFSTDHPTKWNRAIAKLGITPDLLSGAHGTA